MGKPVIVSLLWQKNERVLELLMSKHGYDIACFEGMATANLATSASAAGCRLLPIALRAEPATATAAAARAAQTRTLLPPILDGMPFAGARGATALATVIDEGLESNLVTGMSIVDALDRLAATETLAGLVTNETDLAVSKTATLWAKNRGVPTFLLSHGSNIGPAYTVTAQMCADYLFVFGERGTEPYLDLGVPREAMLVTGNPAWDMYGRYLAARGEIRQTVQANLNLMPAAPVVVFATTWNAKLTALQDRDLVESTTRAFIRAAKALEQRGIPVNAIVKDRPSNGHFGAELVTRIAREEDCQNVRYADGEMPAFLCAADVLVGYDSNAFVEAMILGVPCVGIWAPSSWLLGPALDRRDNIPLVEIDDEPTLAGTLQTILTNADARSELIAAQHARLPHFHLAADGRSAERAALGIAQRLTIPGVVGVVAATAVPAALATTPRPAWHELSRPRTVAQKGLTQEYYDHARPELIDLLDHMPRVVLDIGCAGGATGQLLKARYPGAVVHGIELNAEAAELAERRLDRVLRENVEQLDFARVGFEHGSIDAIFLPDVLEHLYDPWNLLVRLKPYLSSDGQILASIPNSRNLWLINELCAGNFDYQEEGLLDVTHIRFFTLKSTVSLFAETGYSITRMNHNADVRIPELACLPNGTIDITTPKLTFKGIGAQDAWELRTLQFLVDARPVR